MTKQRGNCKSNKSSRLEQTGIGFESSQPIPITEAFLDELNEEGPEMSSWDYTREFCFIIELWDKHAFGEADEFMENLLQLRNDSVQARNYLVHAYATGFEDLGKSYAQQGAEVLHSKQNMHQNKNRMVQKIMKRFPQIAILIKNNFKRI